MSGNELERLMWLFGIAGVFITVGIFIVAMYKYAKADRERYEHAEREARKLEEREPD